MINQKLQEENKSFFHPRSLQLDLLKNHPKVVSQLAKWAYEEWRSYDASLTTEKLIHSYNQRLNTDRIPITFIVLKDAKAIGCISLKEELSPEFSDFPKNSLWLGTLYVVPEERHYGIGQELLKFSKVIAKSLGYKTLYIYISNPLHVDLYTKNGASVIETRPFRNHTITIMQIPL